MKTAIKYCILLWIVIALIGCLAGNNPLVDKPDSDGDIDGFFMGLWHGAILTITLWISLFTDRVSIYSVHNSGWWYDFGYFLGIASVLKGLLQLTSQILLKKMFKICFRGIWINQKIPC